MEDTNDQAPTLDGAVFPINRFPNELLAEIFYIGVLSEIRTSQRRPNCRISDWDDWDKDSECGFASRFDSTNLHPATLSIVISHVCQRWRDIALETALLWSSLEFRVSSTPLKRFTTFLTRAKGAPLDIFIQHVPPLAITPRLKYPLPRNTADFPFVSKNRLIPVFQMLIPCCERWRSLQIFGDDIECYRFVIEQLAECPPAEQLQNFSIAYTGRQPTPIGVLPFQEQTPRLKFVSFQIYSVTWDTSSQLLTNLHHLELSYDPASLFPSWRVWVEIFDSSPALRTLSLSNGDQTNVRQRPFRTTHLVPSIRNLILTSISGKWLQEFLQHFSFPNARNLSLLLVPTGRQYLADSSRVFDMVTTPDGGSVLSGLERLRISGSSSEEVMIRVLKESRNVRVLEVISHEHLVVSLLEKLDSDSSDGASVRYCPQLQIVKFKHTEYLAMKALLRRRKMGGTPLKKVVMSKNFVTDEQAGELRRYVSLELE